MPTDITERYDFDFKERFYPDIEFMDAYWLAREATESRMNGDDAEALEKTDFIFMKLRFVLENISKYRFALDNVDDGDLVLDVPCGDGYGSALLASSASKVYGVDIDRNTIETARGKYGYPNVEFVVGDMMQMDLPRADVIVCLDGLEHISPGDKLIQRFVYALNPGGRFIVSIPINEDLARPDAPNPYHLEDYTEASLRELLEKYFGVVDMFGVDVIGSISDVSNAFNCILAVCEV